MSKKPIDFRQIFIESIFIVFAVSLAFLLNEWRQNIKIEQLVDRVTQTLEDETLANKEKVEKAIQYHSKLLNNLRNGNHIMSKFPLNGVPFDPQNDKQMVSFVEASMLGNLGDVPTVSVIRNNQRRFIAINNRLNEVVIENDTVIIYGKGNIRLKSADVSNNSWQLANATNALVEMDYALVSVMGETSNIYLDYNHTVEKALSILYGEGGSILSVLEDIYGMEIKLLSKYEEILSIMDGELKENSTTDE